MIQSVEKELKHPRKLFCSQLMSSIQLLEEPDVLIRGSDQLQLLLCLLRSVSVDPGVVIALWGPFVGSAVHSAPGTTVHSWCPARASDPGSSPTAGRIGKNFRLHGIVRIFQKGGGPKVLNLPLDFNFAGSSASRNRNIHNIRNEVSLDTNLAPGQLKRVADATDVADHR